MIKFKNAAIGYSNTILFSIDSLELKNGGLYILIGKNGSGKSTLLKSIIGSQPLLSGQITINGKNVQSISKLDLSKSISFVQSTFPQTDYLRVYDYIALGRAPYTNALGRLKLTDKTIIEKAFKILKIEHLRNKFTSDLSDGERQLVSIAKALAQDTSTILLDEPTAFLDYSNKSLLHTTLKRIAKDTNKCIVLSSHDLDLSLETQCDFIAVNSKSKQLEFINAPTSKQDLIEIAFS